MNGKCHASADGDLHRSACRRSEISTRFLVVESKAPISEYSLLFISRQLKAGKLKVLWFFASVVLTCYIQDELCGSQFRQFGIDECEDFFSILDQSVRDVETESEIFFI